MISAFGSNTISFLTDLKSTLPFHDIKSLIIDTDYNLMSFKLLVHLKNVTVKFLLILVNKFYNLCFLFFKDTAKYYLKTNQTDRLFVNDVAEKLFYEACFNDKKKTVIIHTDDRYKAYGKYICPLISIPAKYDTLIQTSGIRKGFKYKRSFDIG